MTTNERIILKRVARAAEFGMPYVSVGKETDILKTLKKSRYVREVSAVYGMQSSVIQWEITKKGVTAL